MANYYNEKILSKFNADLKDAAQLVKTGADMRVRISNGNSKMGAVASVSTLPFITCPARCKETCGKDCYAAKIANVYKTVRKSYAINTALAIHAPKSYWAQVDAACKAVRYFRFHVSGDILNGAYFAEMVKCAENNPHTEMLCFTKRFEIVNTFVRNGGAIPKNLHILFSGWSNLEPVNPYNFPETNVILKNQEPAENWLVCGGNCFECACRGVGCWQAKRGETVAFPIH